MENKCDCGNGLTFEKTIDILDIYDNTALVINEYYCNECYEEYRINEEMDMNDKTIADMIKKYKEEINV